MWFFQYFYIFQDLYSGVVKSIGRENEWTLPIPSKAYQQQQRYSKRINWNQGEIEYWTVAQKS